MHREINAKKLLNQIIYTKNWKALFIHFLNQNLKLNENQANLVLYDIKNKYLKFVFYDDKEHLFKIDGKNIDILKNMLKNQYGYFNFIDDEDNEIKVEPIKLKNNNIIRRQTNHGF